MSATLTLSGPSTPVFTSICNGNREQRLKSYCNEAKRLETFEAWPHNWLDKKILAAVGFFFDSPFDTVQCRFCEVKLSNWVHGDEALSEHLRFSPNCPLLKRHATDNVPIDEKILDSILPPISYDEPPNICPCKYDTYQDRLRSFTNWPHLANPTPEQLAEAGFYSLGIHDWIQCFSCGGNLKDFKSTDDPWVEHARWFSDCRFLKLMKCEQFIDHVNNNGDTGNFKMQAENQLQSKTTDIQAKSSDDDDTQTTSQKSCKICFTNDSNTVFLPCGHVAACVTCAASLSKCPVCRCNLIDIKRIFFS